MNVSEASSAGFYFFLAPWIVFIPLIGLLLNVIFGRWLGEKLTGIVASLASGLAFLVAILLAVSLSAHPETVVAPLATWFSIGDLNLG